LFVVLKTMENFRKGELIKKCFCFTFKEKDRIKILNRLRMDLKTHLDSLKYDINDINNVNNDFELNNNLTKLNQEVGKLNQKLRNYTSNNQ
jgi:hypothetical protein